MIFPNFQSVRYLTSHCHYNSHFVLIITFIRLVGRWFTFLYHLFLIAQMEALKLINVSIIIFTLLKSPLQGLHYLCLCLVTII